MSDELAKQLMLEYNNFQDWIAENDPQGTSFTVEDRSMASTTTTASNTASSTASNPYLSIIVLIYPKTEPFQGRGLRVELRVPIGYPLKTPEVYMLSKIQHPNIEKNRKICTDLLDPERAAAKVIPLHEVMKIIINLMDKPELGHPVNAELGSLYQSNTVAYNRKIREMVSTAGEPRQ